MRGRQKFVFFFFTKENASDKKHDSQNKKLKFTFKILGYLTFFLLFLSIFSSINRLLSLGATFKNLIPKIFHLWYFYVSSLNNLACIIMGPCK